MLLHIFEYCLSTFSNLYNFERKVVRTLTAEYVYERGYYNGIQCEPDKVVAVDDKYLA